MEVAHCMRVFLDTFEREDSDELLVGVVGESADIPSPVVVPQKPGVEGDGFGGLGMIGAILECCPAACFNGFQEKRQVFAAVVAGEGIEIHCFPHGGGVSHPFFSGAVNFGEYRGQLFIPFEVVHFRQGFHGDAEGRQVFAGERDIVDNGKKIAGPVTPAFQHGIVFEWCAPVFQHVHVGAQLAQTDAKFVGQGFCLDDGAGGGAGLEDFV